VIDRQELAVRNQITSREMNEWTEETIDSRPHLLGLLESYVCECSDAACSDPIRLTRAEYEDVRAVPVRFAISLDHEDPESDVVVSENDRFAIVDKFYGAGMRTARSTDPRR